MKYFLSCILICLIPILSGCDIQSQQAIGNILKQIPSQGTPSSLEIATGLKEALSIGTNKGSDQLSAKDGFLGNMAIKILFPPEAQKVEQTLRSLGMNQLADQVILSLNRAAEDAAKEAKPIFLAAIQQMTIADATQILFGEKDAATTYFKRVTTAQLLLKFEPVIKASLQKVGATKYWTDAATAYNKIPLVKPINTNLTNYVATKAIDGMFYQVSAEELKIRDNIQARSSNLLKKVFGYADSRR